MRLFLRSLALTTTLTLASPALLAQDFPAALLTRLQPREGLHPMAGPDGRLGLHVQHAADLDARALGLIPITPGRSLVRLAPQDLDAFLRAHRNLHVGWSPPLRPQLDVATVRSGATEYRAATDLDGTGVLVGIVDTGLDVSHGDLRAPDGSTRVAWLLDLSREPLGKHAQLEEEFGCTMPDSRCAVLDAEQIDALLQAGDVTVIPRDQVGHGTHVASLAAGNGLGSEGARFVGMAPGATLIAARVTRGGSEDVSDGDALLAAKFVFDRATHMGLPAVLNMSLGSDFGPHDGTAWLEQGLASFVGPDKPGHALVVAAGNSGALYLADGDTYGIHTEARVLPGGTTRVPTRALAHQKPTVQGKLYVWLSYRAGEDISVGLEGPGGQTWLAPVPPGRSATYEEGGVKGAVLNEVRAEGSPLPPDSHGAVLYFEGAWPRDGDVSILLEGDGTVDLWLQGVGEAAPSSSGAGQLFRRAVKHGTVNIPATHPSIIAAGALLNRASWVDADAVEVQVEHFGAQRPPQVDSVAYFSGAGPTFTGVPKPDISAPGVFVAGAMSRDATPQSNPFSMFTSSEGLCPSTSQHCLVMDETHALASGTSMASPVVAGAVALLLSRDPTLTQPELLALLQAGVRWPQGEVPYSYQLGPGALDVQGARAVYELLGRPMTREPDPARSWVALGGAYARPDSTWPVCGHVETRAADGLPADGFDSGLLSLRVEQAVVWQPLTRMAPGLWKFCVAAPEGSGGGTMLVEVRYRDGVLGQPQRLPIGVDAFVATYGLQSRGGCAMGRRPGTGLAGWLALLLGAALWRTRRRAGRNLAAASTRT